MQGYFLYFVTGAIRLALMTLPAWAGSGCAGEPDVVAPATGGQPNLFVTRDGRTLLSWLEPTGDTYALRVRVRADGEWSGTRTIAQDRPFLVNWADFPSIVELHDGTWLAHWLEKVGPATYAYHVLVSSSRDGGQTWSDPRRLHTDTSPSEHGFVSMLPLPDGQAMAIWLDGQDTGGHEGGGAMQLRSAILAPDGSARNEMLIDDKICDCCQTALVQAGPAVVAAYRDRSDEEIRDIAVRRYVDGAWSEPVYVGPDRWHFPACPVNGPSLAARGDTVAVAWFAAPDEQARVTVAFSTDGARTFGRPIRVDDGAPLGRVDIEWLPDGSALALWLERTGEDAQIRARTISLSGESGSSRLVAETSQTRSSGFPRMVVTADGPVFAWTEVGENGGVRVRDGW